MVGLAAHDDPPVGSGAHNGAGVAVPDPNVGGGGLWEPGVAAQHDLVADDRIAAAARSRLPVSMIEHPVADETVADRPVEAVDGVVGAGHQDRSPPFGPERRGSGRPRRCRHGLVVGRDDDTAVVTVGVDGGGHRPLRSSAERFALPRFVLAAVHGQLGDGADGARGQRRRARRRGRSRGAGGGRRPSTTRPPAATVRVTSGSRSPVDAIAASSTTSTVLGRGRHRAASHRRARGRGGCATRCRRRLRARPRRGPRAQRRWREARRVRRRLRGRQRGSRSSRSPRAR